MTSSKEQKTPQHVLRFYGKTEYALECIALKQITFLHFDNLNDPFDPSLDFTTDFNDNYATLLNYVHEQHFSQITFFKQRFPEQSFKGWLADWSKKASEIRDSMFVFSTCAVIEKNHPRDNLYMWSHYGNGHRGVAIEFNTTTLAESSKEKENIDGEFPWWEMQYNKTIPKIKCEDIYEEVMNPNSNPNNLESPLACVLRQILHSKGEVWEKEHEWRLVRESDGTKLKIYRHDISENAITAVYLGCRAAEEKQLRNDFVYETQRNFPSASIFMAKMRKGEYALDFEKIV